MSKTITRAQCPGCNRHIALRPENGTLRTHGPIGDRCPGSWQSPDAQPAPRHREISDLIRRHWQIGDALAVSRLTGISYPAPLIPAGLNLDQELAFLISDARSFIAHVARELSQQ